jgi:hypothetical protein
MSQRALDHVIFSLAIARYISVIYGLVRQNDILHNNFTSKTTSDTTAEGCGGNVRLCSVKYHIEWQGQKAC